MAYWLPRTAYTILDVRKGGPGNPWQILEYEAELAAPSGGGQPVDSKWGRGTNGNPEYKGQMVTGNPERITAQIMSRLKSETFLSELTKVRCSFDIRARQKCDDPNVLTSYNEAIILRDGSVTSYGYSGQLVNSSTDQDEDIKSTYDASFGLETRMVKLRHDNLSGTVSDVDINKVRCIDVDACAGRCDNLGSTGDQKFIAVTDVDSTSGYAAIPCPVFLYTLDGGNTWTATYVDVLPSGNGTDVLKVGDYILVNSPTKGIAYARWQDILDGVTAPNLWSLSTGFTLPNAPNRIDSINGTTVLAVGNTGRVWISTDSGISFTALAAANAITTQNLNCVVMVNETLGWIGGASGVLLRYDQGVLSTVVVQKSTGVLLSTSILSIAVPSGRGRELFLGTSDGYIWKSTNGLAGKPIFTTPTFDQQGTGQITDMQFAGLFGSVLFFVQTNAASDSRVQRDISGGYLTVAQCEIIGSYVFPANNKINSIAPANINVALTVGDIAGTSGFIGKLSGIVSQ